MALLVNRYEACIDSNQVVYTGLVIFDCENMEYTLQQKLVHQINMLGI